MDIIKQIKENIQLILAIIASLSQLIIYFLATLKKLSYIFWSHPYLYILTIYIIMLIVILLPLKKEISYQNEMGVNIKMKKLLLSYRLKFFIIIVITSISLFVLYGIYSILNPQINSDPPRIEPPFIQSEFKLIPSAYAQVNNIQIRWELVNQFSSLKSSKNGEDLSISPDFKIFQKIADRKGTRKDNNPPEFDDILDFLRSRCMRLQGSTCSYYLHKNDLNLIDLIFDHPDIVKSLNPRQDEFDGLSSKEKRILQYWFVYYIGQWSPKIRITVDNSLNNKPLQLISFIYDIKEISEFKALIQNLDLIQTYKLSIPYMLGKYEYAFSKEKMEISVPKGESRTIDIILCPEENAPLTPSWLGIAYLKTNQGVLKIGKLNLSTFNNYRWEGKK